MKFLKPFFWYQNRQTNHDTTTVIKIKETQPQFQRCTILTSHFLFFPRKPCSIVAPWKCDLKVSKYMGYLNSYLCRLFSTEIPFKIVFYAFVHHLNVILMFVKSQAPTSTFWKTKNTSAIDGACKNDNALTSCLGGCFVIMYLHAATKWLYKLELPTMM